MTDDEYLAFNKKFNELAAAHVAAHPTCQVCKEVPAVWITNWGQVQSACQPCRDEEKRRFYEHCQSEEESEENYKREYGGAFYE